MVQLLLEYGIDAQTQGRRWGTPIRAATHRGEASIVALLLEGDTQVNDHQGDLDSPLQMAVTGFDNNDALLLLSQVNKLEQVENVLQSAMANGKGARLGSLQFYPKVWNGEPSFSIEEPVVDRETVAKLLLERGADVHAHGSFGTALHAAAYMGNSRIARLLIEEFGAEVNHEAGPFGTVLQAAVYEAHDDMVEILLEHSANPFADGGTCGSPLEAATEQRYLFILIALLNHRSMDEFEKGLVRRALEKAKSITDEWERNSIVEVLERKLSDQGIVWCSIPSEDD